MDKASRVRGQTSALRELQERIGHRFADQALLEAALTHPSALPSPGPHRMEQLEFLGDAVLGLMLGDLLLQRYPNAAEGELSQYRAAMANTEALAAKARALGLHEAIALGRGEEKSGGRRKESILAASYEAVLGAVYLDGGCEASRRCVEAHFREELAHLPKRTRFDPKTALQELCQSRYGTTPRYVTAAASGPDHARWFVVAVSINGVIMARGEGKSKRAAEREAARTALEILTREIHAG